MLNKMLGAVLILGLACTFSAFGGFALVRDAIRGRRAPRHECSTEHEPGVAAGNPVAGAVVDLDSAAYGFTLRAADHTRVPGGGDPRAGTRGRTMLNRILGGAAVIGLIGAFFSSGSLALFTDTQSVPANTFVSGTVDISSNPTTALVTFSAMAPGDQVTAPITVTNAGTMALRYAVTSTTTENVLAAALDLTIKSGVTTCTDAGFGTDGTVLYGPADLGNTTAVNVIGSPATGADSGDRALAASASEVLCFNVSLPLATTTGQGVTSTGTFAFVAEQTANN